MDSNKYYNDNSDNENGKYGSGSGHRENDGYSGYNGHSKRNKKKRKDTDVSATILVEGKKLYTDQLINLLYPEIYKGIRSIWYNSKVEAEKWSDENSEKPSKSPLLIFQEKLSMIRKWSDEIISNEYARIIEETNCDYYDKLIEAVFVSHVKVLSSVRLCKKERPIELRVPHSKNFVHKCYIETSKKFIENPYLIEDREEKIDYMQIQKNLNESYKVISICVIKAIQNLLPTKEILEQNLQQDSDSDYESDYSNHSRRSQKSDKIKDIVRRELDRYIESESERSENSRRNNENDNDNDRENDSSGSRESVSSTKANSESPDLETTDDYRRRDNNSDNDNDSDNESGNNSNASHDLDNEYVDQESDQDSFDETAVPIPVGEQSDRESVKQVIVPANKKLAAQKHAEENLIPEIKERIEKNPTIDSDTLFLSDAED